MHPSASTKLPDCVTEQRQDSLAHMPSVAPRIKTRNNAENQILKYVSGFLYNFEYSAVLSEFSRVQ